jgi:prolyl-tRNA editing enzyme YbaK/EbsC (Cys-tRNA(Pro) deacylase)
MVEALQISLNADGVFQVVTPGTQKIDLENVQQKR